MGSLMNRLDEEMREFSLALATRSNSGLEHLLEEAADVANFTMMVADVCGALERPEDPS